MSKINKKILIVEDDLPLQSALQEAFTNEGFLVLAAGDGQEGLEITKREKPDLVLVDILLPKMDGITMAREIKKLGLGTLMIFLTNVSDVEHIADASEAVYADYLVKSNWSIKDIIGKVKGKLGLT